MITSRLDSVLRARRIRYNCFILRYAKPVGFYMVVRTMTTGHALKFTTRLILPSEKRGSIPATHQALKYW